MRASEITTQSLSTLISDFLICKNCGYVDKDSERIRVGYPCQTCKHPGEGGRLYYGNNVHSVVDLIQEAFHSLPNPETPQWMSKYGPDSHHLSVLIFFCTLKEILMDQFLQTILIAKNIESEIIERLLNDNKMYAERQNKLFPSLVGKKWDAFVKEVSIDGSDYQPINAFMKQASDLRNRFVHEGRAFKVDQQVAESCVEGLWPLISLFVEGHNQYAHPLIWKNGASAV